MSAPRPTPPDIVLILTDQERAPPAYETHALAAWRERALPARRWFRDHGVTFAHHYTGSTACVPSRATLLTGQYPDVHGVTQTTGIGKHADDPRIRWLRPDEVPTLGHWMRAAGYETRYEGKWHVSDADLLDPDSGHPLATNTARGQEHAAAIERYREAAPLEAYGFSGWVGPEPHGPRFADSGLARDPLFADRVVAFFDERNRRWRAGDASARRPLFLVVSFVNPHDIVFWPRWARRSPLAPDPLDPPVTPEAPSARETLRDKPAVQAAYREAYPGFYGPPRLVRRLYDGRAAAYRRAYHRLHLEVDRQIDRVRRAVLEGPRGDSTALVLSSDHGELLGSHGGLHQKWLSLYDEAIRVPFVIAHTGATGPVGTVVSDRVTSHVDLVPTVLGLSGFDPSDLAATLERSHSEVHPLPGADLSPLVLGTVPPPPGPVYVMTRDNISEGADVRNFAGRLLGVRRGVGPLGLALPADVATNLEAVIATVDAPEAAGGGGHRWKLVRTFDDPATWTEPHVRHLAARTPWGTRYRTVPVADAWELYDLDVDPSEQHDRSGDATVQAVRDALSRELSAVRARAVPRRNEPWPYAATTAGDESAPHDAGAMRDLVVCLHRVVPASPAHVWSTLADFGTISDWYPDAQHSAVTSERRTGLGTVRRVQISGLTVLETVTEWEPERRLAYALAGLPPIVAAASNAWTLTAADAGTRIELTLSFATHRGRFAERALRLVLPLAMERVGRRLIEGLVGAVTPTTG